MRLLVFSVVLALSVVGCAYIDQNVKVNPTISLAKSDIGKGKKVSVQIIDDREEQIIGKRRDGYGLAGAKITTDQDLVEVLKVPIFEGLSAKGFLPTQELDNTIALKVELRSLAYDNAVGLWTGGNIGKATIKVVATNAVGKTYEKNYRGQKEIRTFFVGSQETNAKVINGAFEEAILRMFEDEELLKFLNQL